MIKYLLLLALVPLLAFGVYQSSDASNWDQIPVSVRQNSVTEGGIGFATSKLGGGSQGNVSIGPEDQKVLNAQENDGICGDKICRNYELSTAVPNGNISLEPVLVDIISSVNHQINPKQVVCGDHLCGDGEHYSLDGYN